VLESFVLPEVKQAEDFAYHEPSGLIVLTAPGNPSGRYGWWPPILHLDRPEDATTTDGGIYILDPTVRTFLKCGGAKEETVLTRRPGSPAGSRSQALPVPSSRTVSTSTPLKAYPTASIFTR
jgi:hypothetical protein